MDEAVRHIVWCWRGADRRQLVSFHPAVQALTYSELVDAINAACAVLAFGVEPL